MLYEIYQQTYYDGKKEKNMKGIIFVITLSFWGIQLQAQDFLDIIKASANFTQKANNSDKSITNIYNQSLQFYFPKRINNKTVLITGFKFENTTLDLLNGFGNENLITFRLNLGANFQHNKKWGSTFLITPKITSNFKDIGINDFQFGGIGFIDYTINENWKIKLGFYASSESHGSTMTPILGFWHRSKNRKFYIDALLPVSLEANYNLIKEFSLGLDFISNGQSYNISKPYAEYYVKEASIRTSLYASYGFLKNAIILKGRAGLNITDYSLFNAYDKLGAEILIFTLSKDDRSRLNPKYKPSFYFGIDLMYRFDLRNENK
jgi:hypothetical protein